MKILAVILSVYILSLNFTPCGDVATDVSDTQTKISQQLNDKHNHGDADFCSPFCHCNCCHTLTIDFPIASFEPLKALYSKKDFFIPEIQEQGILFSILQPPRV